MKIYIKKIDTFLLNFFEAIILVALAVLALGVVIGAPLVFFFSIMAFLRGDWTEAFGMLGILIVCLYSVRVITTLINNKQKLDELKTAIEKISSGDSSI